MSMDTGTEHPIPRLGRTSRQIILRVVGWRLLLICALAVAGYAIFLASIWVGPSGGSASWTSQATLPISIVFATFWIVLLVWKLPQVQAHLWRENHGGPRGDQSEGDRQYDIEREARESLVRILTGVTLALGLLFTLNETYETRQSTERNFRLVEEGQITDRYTSAIDQIGAQNPLEIRLGGIYALGRIARDSPEDAATVMEVLAAYVRTHTIPDSSQDPPLTGLDSSGRTKSAGNDVRSSAAVSTPSGGQDIPLELPPGGPPGDIPAIGNGLPTATPSANEPVDLPLPPDANSDGIFDPPVCMPPILGTDQRREPSLDVAAALSIIATRPPSVDGQSITIRLDGSDLTGASLGGANLQGVSLFDTILYDADLRGANLQGSRLTLSDLRCSDLTGADLRGADLTLSQLQFSSLVGAHLDDVNIAFTSFDYADLRDATLARSNFSVEVTVEGTCLFGVDLSQTQELVQEQVDAAYTDDLAILPIGLVNHPDVGIECAPTTRVR